MSRKRLPYPEGTWFAVPLETSGYAIGVLARTAGKGPAFGYFFGPRRETIPNLSDVESLRPEVAVVAALFGDLGLLKGKWPVLGRQANWNRDLWPLPALGRVDDVSNKALMVTYSDSLDMIESQPCTVEYAKQLPSENLWGYSVVEFRLTRLLDRE